MKYRWGFLDENDIFSECDPKVDNATALDHARESNEMFYRAKLNGSLSFRFEFNDIIAQGYNVEHRVVLQCFDNDLNDWREIWRGRFALTDCEIDFDTNTITVKPQTLDRYTNILDHLEDEYNLIKIAAEQQPVGILIRPCLQIYALNDTKISNWIGGLSWEGDCEAVGAANIADFHFTLIKETFTIGFKWLSGTYAGKYGVYTATITQTLDVGTVIPLEGWVYDPGSNDKFSDNTLSIMIYPPAGYTVFAIVNTGLGVSYATIQYEKGEAGSIYELTYESPDIENPVAQWDKIYQRYILRSDEPEGTNLPTFGYIYDISANDMAGMNANYNKISTISTAFIIPSIDSQIEPTEWGVTYDDRYFTKPTNANRIMPIGQTMWKYMCYWFYNGVSPQTLDNAGAYSHTIKDTYKLPSIIMRLCGKAGFTPNSIVSRVLDGTNDYVGEPFYLCLTAKSNIISSYYDTPAQNAPISLAKVFSMLKQAYKIYWHIDENDNIYLEHISYYENGFSYTETQPDVLVDLDTTIHTNTKSAKDYGQNKVKFDKSDMPQTFTFGWMDAQTKPFDGWPLKCLDNYVQKGTTEEKIIGDFSTDIDFILSSPGNVSKEGFAILACPSDGVNVSWTLNTQTYTITDENGERYDITIQNEDASFFKICRSYWRYALPCENIEVNNEPSNAITTGNFKSQSIEFADTAMAEVLKDADNANKIIRTQQGDGHVKTISVNLNSLTTSGDLLFNFIGRWYYLRGTALGNSIIVNFNGESITISVDDNRFTYRYKEPISVLKFNAADVVSVNFADCDKLNNLTSADEMFDGCEELLAVDFGNKTFSAVTSANNMFRGCVALTTLICPDSSTWKPDIDLSDCPDLTTESFYDLIKFLYFYNSGVHTITPNSTMWNSLDADTQNDLIAKATERGWTIGIPAQYSITGQSAANTVYATINGSPVEISVVGGSWEYDYNTPITSISFENDADVTDIDFSLSDGLAGVASLNDAFKNCAGLTTVDFTNCDLSNVASASDAFAGCIALYELIIPQDTWQPDVDLSDGVMPKSEMLNVINGLYVYTSGTHTITFNQTIWDAMSVADQQIVFDAADAKGWTTNAVAVVYSVKGKSTAASETFAIQYIMDGELTPETAETVTVAVDGNGDWQFDYLGKKIYSLYRFAYTKNTITELDFSAADDFSQLVDAEDAFYGCIGMTNIVFGTQTFAALTNAYRMFYDCYKLPSIDLQNAIFPNLLNANSMFLISGTYFNSALTTAIDLRNATFANVTSCEQMFWQQKKLSSLNLSSATFAATSSVYGMFRRLQTATSLNFPSATFASATNLRWMFYECSALQSVNLGAATFASATNATAMFQNDTNLSTITWSPNLNFSNLQTIGTAGADEGMFEQCGLTSLDFTGQTFENVTIATAAFYLPKATTIKMPNATFAKLTNAQVMFIGAASNNPLTELDLSSATFQVCVNTKRVFDRLHNLTTLKLPQNSTAIALSTAPVDGPVDIQWSPLTYQSMLNAAMWVRDFTGYSAHTMTFKASAWNALSTAEQNNIDTILSGKNWTRAIA